MAVLMAVDLTEADSAGSTVAALTAADSVADLQASVAVLRVSEAGRALVDLPADSTPAAIAAAVRTEEVMIEVEVTTAAVLTAAAHRATVRADEAVRAASRNGRRPSAFA